jgi:hypothetical protein
MAEERHAKSTSWQCKHLYPVLMVTWPEGQRRARCLGCGMLGPSSSNVATALRALRESAARLEGA